MDVQIEQTGALLDRFPKFELSYETVQSHKKVSPDIHNLALAIPHGKKYYAWFSYDIPAIDTVFIMELNKEKRITKITKHLPPQESEGFRKIYLGTILYGVLLPDAGVFIIEDLIQYSGFPMKNMTYGEKLPLLCEFMEATKCNPIRFRLPAIWAYRGEHDESTMPPKYRNLPYQVHHIQYRALTTIAPLVNYQVKTFDNTPITPEGPDTQKTILLREKPRGGILDQVSIMRSPPCHTKPQYRIPTVFHVCADIQYDIYHLFAYGKSKTLIYYDLAYIPNYNTSRFMNSLFRNIRENQNLDSIEESDDEDDFQNTAEDKYVYLNRILLIECRFHPKFRRWVPIRQVSQPCKIVHVSQL